MTCIDCLHYEICKIEPKTAGLNVNGEIKECKYFIIKTEKNKINLNNNNNLNLQKIFEIKQEDLFNMGSCDFYEFVDFCKNKTNIEIFKNLYKFLDRYSYDFAVEYIGEDL